MGYQTISCLVEMRAGQGGQDARCFVAELAMVYHRLAAHKG